MMEENKKTLKKELCRYTLGLFFLMTLMNTCYYRGIFCMI